MRPTESPNLGISTPVEDPAHQAVAAIRGYVFQFAVAIDLCIASPDEAVYVEAFEDLASSNDGSGFSYTQIKHVESASFSLRTESALLMLDRWAERHTTEQNASFVFLSTQPASTISPVNTAFQNWLASGRSDESLDLIRTEIASTVHGSNPNKYANLFRLLTDPSSFAQFFHKTSWNFASAGLDSTIERLVAGLASKHGDRSQDARERLYTWLGAIAISASDESIQGRRWTLKKLYSLQPSSALQQLVAVLLRDRTSQEASRKVINHLRLISIGVTIMIVTAAIQLPAIWSHPRILRAVRPIARWLGVSVRTIELTPSSLSIGETLAVSIRGYKPDGEYFVLLVQKGSGHSIASITCDATGAGYTKFVFPAVVGGKYIDLGHRMIAVGNPEVDYEFVEVVGLVGDHCISKTDGLPSTATPSIGLTCSALRLWNHRMEVDLELWPKIADLKIIGPILCSLSYRSGNQDRNATYMSAFQFETVPILKVNERYPVKADYRYSQGDRLNPDDASAAYLRFTVSAMMDKHPDWIEATIGISPDEARHLLAVGPALKRNESSTGSR